jgi:hypothetical protein
MYNMVEHHWWQRAWIYQEFIVASRAYFVFLTTLSIDWGELASLLDVFLALGTAAHRGLQASMWTVKNTSGVAEGLLGEDLLPREKRFQQIRM